MPVSRVAVAAARAGAWRQGGLHAMPQRTFASEKSSEGQENESDKKTPPPKAGPGFWQTFRQSFAEQMTKRSQEDEKFQQAREQVGKARDDAGAAAQRAMEVGVLSGVSEKLYEH